MPGAQSRKLGIQPGQDKAGKYQQACIEFADEYGFTRGEICFWWSQIAMAREFWGMRSRDVAEDGAWHDIKHVFLKYGEPD